jgi:hypothetical protein
LGSGVNGTARFFVSIFGTVRFAARITSVVTYSRGSSYSEKRLPKPQHPEKP